MSTAAYQKEWYHRRKKENPEAHAARIAETTQYKKEWRRKRRREMPDVETAKNRRARLRTIHGITPEDYDFLFRKQNGLCALCGKPPEALTGKLRLAVDHDHATDRIRSLLHPTCNMLLGLAHDDPNFLELAALYLRKMRGLT